MLNHWWCLRSSAPNDTPHRRCQLVVMHACTAGRRCEREPGVGAYGAQLVGMNWLLTRLAPVWKNGCHGGV